MHSETLGRRQHSHVFLGPRHDENERRTWAVVALTAVTMVAEIVGGTVLGSMALVADGWHMATHAGALGMAALAYRFARRHAEDERFGFGTGKFGDLAAYSSAMILGVVALLVGYESVARLYNPVSIGFDQAIAIAVLGLGVNLASAWLLREDPMHGHHAEALDGPHAHGHRHRHDHNLRAAYAHVLADALTSVLAIAALLAGRFFGWVWMDPVMGLVGAVIIAHWAVGLMRASGAVLLDTVPCERLAAQVKGRLEQGTDRVADLHLWRLGPGHLGVVAAIVSDLPRPPDAYKARLAGVAGLSHVTIEVHAGPAAGVR
ncbi:MAG TPA: CDF family Co(II)/Ni(II) efflux transporter DmeF [Hyphomicrobiaceae bacterium]|jgi:cation diffusion facilitator family transporter|nr:CDF family Co(II)/Ni(II) efflux transporter DmeF [Hyphomicrobiaceae bacterium]